MNKTHNSVTSYRYEPAIENIKKRTVEAGH